MALNITDLPEDIITMIINHMDDATPLVCTCHRFYNIGQGYGYLKHLYYRSGDNLDSFKQKFHTHHRCLKSVVIDGLYDPQHWLPFYPKGIFMNIISVPFDLNSMPIYNFNPNDDTSTEVLYIIASRFSPCLLKINWIKFRRLKCLYLSAHTIELDGIEKLDNLTEISIDFGHNNLSTMNVFGYLSKLPALKCVNINSNAEGKDYRDLCEKGVQIKYDPQYNPNYRDLYMYLITGKIRV